MADMNLHQQMALGQALSVQMQQSLHLLQAPALELQSLVQQEIAANPVLEEISEPPSTSDEMEDLPQTASESQRDDDWKEYFSQSNVGSSRYTSEDAEKRQFFFDSQSEGVKLSDHLSQQLALSDADTEIVSAGDEIIGNLDERGFLKVPLEEIAMSAQVPYEKVLKALEIIQTFEPS